MLEKDIFTITTSEDFAELSLKVFQYQYQNTAVYRKFCDFLKLNPYSVKKITDIPFLPIQFFKSHSVISEGFSSEIIFSSSGTTGSLLSRHYVAKLDLYEKSFTKAFQNNYGDPSAFAILALLPSYLERKGSSLVYMVDNLIKKSSNPNSGFYLDNTDGLVKKFKVSGPKQSKKIADWRFLCALGSD